jgi:hypothetical protein
MYEKYNFIKIKTNFCGNFQIKIYKKQPRIYTTILKSKVKEYFMNCQELLDWWSGSSGRLPALQP